MIARPTDEATDRGAETGPPVAISPTPADPPNLGPLPEQSLFERLRANWSLSAFAPSFDPKDLKRPEWRAAGAAALVTHILLIAAIVYIGKNALMTFVDEPDRATVIDFGKTDTPEITEPQPETSTGGSGSTGGDGSVGGAGGGNTALTPVSRGEIPIPKPAPPLILPPPTTPTPVLPMHPNVKGPDVSFTPPTGPIGLPDAPPAPDSPGNQGSGGVGTSRGDGGGSTEGDGTTRGAGNGGSGGSGGTGGGTGRVPGTGPGQTPGQGGTGSGGSAPLNRPVRMVYRARPAIPAAMAENNITGKVTFRVTIGPDGRLVTFAPIQPLSHGGTAAATEALKRCRFEPAIRNGVPVSETTVVSIEFRPN